MRIECLSPNLQEARKGGRITCRAQNGDEVFVFSLIRLRSGGWRAMYWQREEEFGGEPILVDAKQPRWAGSAEFVGALRVMGAADVPA